MSINDEDSFDPVTIDSKGNIDSVPAMSPGSLASALKAIAKYALLMEEEENAKKASQETEEDAASKD
jgi:hypothetical protein